jgi:hypothetical protein
MVSKLLATTDGPPFDMSIVNGHFQCGENLIRGHAILVTAKIL